MPVSPLKLYNTLSRSIETFEPLDPTEVKVYCCGPTVYNYQHIGNLRTYIFEDLLIRTLRFAGYQVKHVMNVTDVGHLVSDADEGEDKMLLAAKREGKKSEELADYYTKVFFEHCSWLNIIRPDIVCKATEHVQQMIELIERIEENGLAYLSAGNVYFDVCKFQDYGKLAKLDLGNLQAGARIEVDQNKKSPLDFALWFTKSKFEDQELQWDSPWGRGYPGWHIECSAMAMKYLGEQFDIHCGGIDHIPVHHTNEIAQSEAASGKQFVNYWLHGGFLVTSEKGKMSKSAGEFLTLDVLKDRAFDPISYRLFCLSGTYRNELSWSWEALEGAANSLKKLKAAVFEWKKDSKEEQRTLSEQALKFQNEFQNAIFHDLGFPKALAILHAVSNDNNLNSAEKLQLFQEFDQVLGLGVEDWREEEYETPTTVLQMAKERETARQNKNWAEADRLRDEILGSGFSVEDTPNGPKLKKL